MLPKSIVTKVRSVSFQKVTLSPINKMLVSPGLILNPSSKDAFNFFLGVLKKNSGNTISIESDDQSYK